MYCVGPTPRGCPLLISFMKNDHNKHLRSIRLRDYDYKQSGAYFVTMVTQNRACLFGDVLDGQLRLNDAGQMIQAIWDQLPEHYPNVETDAFVIMPNHVHGIIVVFGRGGRLCRHSVRRATTGGCPYKRPATETRCCSVIGRYRSSIQNAYDEALRRQCRTIRLEPV